MQWWPFFSFMSHLLWYKKMPINDQIQVTLTVIVISVKRCVCFSHDVCLWKSVNYFCYSDELDASDLADWTVDLTTSFKKNIIQKYYREKLACFNDGRVTREATKGLKWKGNCCLTSIPLLGLFSLSCFVFIYLYRSVLDGRQSI